MIMSQKANVHSTVQCFSNGDSDRKGFTRDDGRLDPHFRISDYFAVGIGY